MQWKKEKDKVLNKDFLYSSTWDLLNSVYLENKNSLIKDT